MTDDERMQRESSLIATIKKNLPDFAKACADDTELVLLHQDALAADYQDDEYPLLGMAIKYAGLSFVCQVGNQLLLGLKLAIAHAIRPVVGEISLKERNIA
jgi:hypothetical protein